MTTKHEHLQYLHEKGKFTVDCNHIIFSTEDIEILEKYGHWFMALTKGELDPISDLQKEFILVAKGERSPFTIEEFAWFKYLGRKAVEAKSGNKLYEHPHLQEDTFYSRDMAKKLKKMMCGEMGKNHKL
ncbi:MAG: DUF413 domain-containing protein [Lentimicrobium sp.]